MEHMARRRRRLRMQVQRVDRKEQALKVMVRRESNGVLLDLRSTSRSAIRSVKEIPSPLTSSTQFGPR